MMHGEICSSSSGEWGLALAEHYQQVLDDPTGESHGNIRQFISTGWSGIRFEGAPLRQRPNPTGNMTREETPS